MRKFALSFGFLVGTVALSLSTVAAQAQATRTWVSGEGDDVNSCSRVAPCQTFAGALARTATNGIINCLDGGGFGTVTITKSVTIDCHEELGSILASGSTGITVNIPTGVATDTLRTVRIRNLRIDGVGSNGRSGITGIRILAAASVIVEDTLIQNFTQGGISVAPTTPALDLTIHDSMIGENAGGGLILTAAAGRSITATLDNVRLTGNVTAGISLTKTTTGTIVANVTDSQIENGSNFGIRSVGAGALVRLSGSAVTGNATGLSAITSGQIISLRNNLVLGNTADGAFTSSVPLK